jgi:ubiquinone/menaquinone biosynthesis C-methylase UbiE
MPAGRLDFTGERFVPEARGNIELEHLHRYLQACEIAAGKVVLDIASGEGYGSAMLANRAGRVFGVDNSLEAVEHARNRYKKENLEFMAGHCAAIPLPDKSVDLVVSFETIEHHDKHHQMMREIKRVLRPAGALLISSPDKRWYSI